MAKHFQEGGCGIRSFIELWFLDNLENIDFSKREELLEQGGLLSFAKTASRLSKIWFDDLETDAVCQQMEEYILYGGVYGTLGNIFKIKAAHGENKSKNFPNYMFLSREKLAERFPLLEKYPILLPFYQVKRWFRVFNKGRRNYMKHRVDLRNGLSKQDINSTTELLEYLGLGE